MIVSGQALHIAHIDPVGWRNHLTPSEDDHHICHAAENETDNDSENVSSDNFHVSFVPVSGWGSSCSSRRESVKGFQGNQRGQSIEVLENRARPKPPELEPRLSDFL